MVLSGCYGEDFVKNLKEKGIDEFFGLPYEEKALLRGVTGLLSVPKA